MPGRPSARNFSFLLVNRGRSASRCSPTRAHWRTALRWGYHQERAFLPCVRTPCRSPTPAVYRRIRHLSTCTRRSRSRLPGVLCHVSLRARSRVRACGGCGRAGGENNQAHTTPTMVTAKNCQMPVVIHITPPNAAPVAAPFTASFIKTTLSYRRRGPATHR